MEFLSDSMFSFQSRALEKDAFAVVEFSGRQAISRCYGFDILLVTGRADIDFQQVLSRPARLVIHRQDQDDVTFHGVLAGFEQQQAAGEAVFYRASLVPRLWWLSLTHHNQVFLDRTVQQMTEAVLGEAGLTSRDYEFRLQAEHPRLRYVCQYNESNLDFISRRLEREGIYYFFEQTPDGEKIIFTDSKLAHRPDPLGDRLVFAPQSGMVDAEKVEAVQGLVCRCKPMPAKVRLKDYNYRKPSLDVEASAVVDENGRGEVYLYGEHFRSPEQGKKLARIRAQEIACRKQQFFGESTAPFLSPGYTFSLDGHFRRDFNRKYLVTEVTHEGSQAGSLTGGIKEALAGREKETFYRNQFVSLANDVQFRPGRTTPQPKITGTLNARIDAAGSGKYAELDDYGRYKVILPFDLSGRKDGKASAWLRMAQPYAGADHGMHFPLHKGAEVLLTFIEGNPDRPVIAAAVPNAEAPSPVTSADQTMAKITTSGGNKIHMEDKEGNQRILLHSPTSGTFLRLGAPNDPDDQGNNDQDQRKKELAGAKLVTEDALKISAGAKNEIIMGEETETVLGGHMKTVAPVKVDVTVGIETGLKIAAERMFTPKHIDLRIKRTRVSEKTVNLDQTRTSMATSAYGFYLNKREALLNAIRSEEDTTELTEQATILRAVDTQVNQASTKLSEAYNELIQDHNKIVETENTVAQTVNTLGEAINTLAETVTVLAETDVTMAETQISLADSYVITSAETIII